MESMLDSNWYPSAFGTHSGFLPPDLRRLFRSLKTTARIVVCGVSAGLLGEESGHPALRQRRRKGEPQRRAERGLTRGLLFQGAPKRCGAPVCRRCRRLQPRRRTGVRRDSTALLGCCRIWAEAVRVGFPLRPTAGCECETGRAEQAFHEAHLVDAGVQERNA